MYDESHFIRTINNNVGLSKNSIICRDDRDIVKMLDDNNMWSSFEYVDLLSPFVANFEQSTSSRQSRMPSQSTAQVQSQFTVCFRLESSQQHFFSLKSHTQNYTPKEWEISAEKNVNTQLSVLGGNWTKLNVEMCLNQFRLDFFFCGIIASFVANWNRALSMWVCELCWELWSA